MFTSIFTEPGTTCRRIGVPDEHCVHYSKCSQENRGITKARSEFCHFDGLRAILCCVSDYLPYESPEEDCEEDHPFTFSVDEDDYHNHHHHYGHDTKPTTSNYPGYYPPQKPRPGNNDFPPNGDDGNQKPSTKRPIIQTTETKKKPIFISPTTPNYTNNESADYDIRENNNGITSISNTPTQQQVNPIVNVQAPSVPVTTSSGVGAQSILKLHVWIINFVIGFSFRMSRDL